MRLYKAALVSAFGGRNRYAYRAAVLRLGLIGVLATCCSLALARITEQLPLADTPSTYALFPSALLAMEVVVIGSLLMASGAVGRMYTGRFSRWLLLLPISSLQRWVILMTPSIVLAALAALAAIWPLAHLWLHLGIQPHLFVIASFGGVVCALGIFHALPPRLAILRFLFIPYMVWIQYRLVAAVASPVGYTRIAPLYTFMALACALALAWVWSSRYIRAAIRHNSETRPVRFSYLPARWWHVKKCFRSPALRLSWLTAVILVLAIVAADRSFVLGLPTISLATAIIIAAFVSDIRAASKRTAPAEITALRGSWYFTVMHSIAALLLSTFTVAPVLLYLGYISVTLLGSIWMGIATGLFAGSALVPAPRDVSGQFVSGLLCIGILGILPHTFNTITDENLQPLFHFGLGIILLFATFAIEYKRNPYTWRTHHD